MIGVVTNPFVAGTGSSFKECHGSPSGFGPTPGPFSHSTGDANGVGASRYLSPVSTDEHTRRSGDFVARAVSDGAWWVTVGDNLEAVVGTVRPNGSAWEAVRHRPVQDFEGGTYNHLPPIVIGSAPTVESAVEMFSTPVSASEQAFFQDPATGAFLCPVDGHELDRTIEGRALLVDCPRCDYRVTMPFLS